MIRKYAFLASLAVASAFFVAPASALTTGVFNPGNIVDQDLDGGNYSFAYPGLVTSSTTYSGSVTRDIGESFTDQISFTFNPIFPSSNTVSVLLGGTGFSALAWSWIDPNAVTQNGPVDVLAGGNNLTVPLIFSVTGTYILQLVGTTTGQGGIYNFDLVTGPGGGGEVPLPPALFLFGTVLAGGMGLMRYRKKAAVAA